MDKELSIVLIEDEENICNETQKYIDTLEDTVLVGVTGDSAKAFELTQHFLPDAIILDLELHFGSGNGLMFLSKLNAADLPKRPYILITTNNSSVVTYDAVRRQGADFIMSKHQQDYSPKAAVDFLRMMKQAIQGMPQCNDNNKKKSADIESPDIKNKRMIKRVSLELDRVGISPKAVGYKYLTDAILMIMSEPQKNISAHIAQKYGKTDSSVERAMQNAINKAWHTADIDELAEYYTARISSDRGVPTLNEFIFYYATKLKNEF